MDTKDIKEEIPKLDKYGAFPIIWALQLELLEKYQAIEGLPLWPMNLDLKANQEIMKDFLARVVEELAESYEAMTLHDTVNAQEELADAMHFFVEALIYVTGPSHLNNLNGVDYEGNLIQYYLKTAPEEGAPENIEQWFWMTTYHLNIARNNLRNKKWKQTQVLAQKAQFLTNMSKALHIFINGYNLLGMGEEEIFRTYFLKNRVNWFRIKSKY